MATESYYPPRLSGFFVLLLISVVLISTTTILFLKPSVRRPAVISPSPTPINTSTWNTYNQKQNGFEFKYPASWENSDSRDSNNYFKTDANNTVGFNVDTDTSVTIADYLQKVDKLSKTAFEGQPSIQVQSTLKTLINGLNCIQRQEYLIAAGLTQINTYFKKGSVVVSVSLRPSPGNTISEDRLLYNQLLSTFKFTK